MVVWFACVCLYVLAKAYHACGIKFINRTVHMHEIRRTIRRQHDSGFILPSSPPPPVSLPLSRLHPLLSSF